MLNSIDASPPKYKSNPLFVAKVTRSINTRVTENNNALNLLKQAAESTFADSFGNHTVKTSTICQKDLNGKV